MGKGRTRWGTKSLRYTMPLPGEVDGLVRTDGRYVGQGHEVCLMPNGSAATLDGSPATIAVHDGAIRISSEDWDAEGRIGLSELRLLASPAGDHHAREAWILEFVPDER